MNEDTKRKAPAFLFYADDFLAGTADMSAEEVGGYIRLLCHQWTKGSIPNDPERVARMAGLMGSPCVGYVLAKFRLCDGHTLKNARLEKVREEHQAFKARQSTAGANGAAKRWGKCPDDGDPNGVAIATPMATPWPEHSQTIAGPMATQWPEDSSPSPSPSPIVKKMADRPPSVRFQKPTVEELTAEAIKIGLPLPEVDKFLNYYESNGWKVGKNSMKSWPAAMKGWLSRLGEASGLVGCKGAEKSEVDWRKSL
jgi:uncharacterized protein YdaU (DUF1376 family)